MNDHAPDFAVIDPEVCGTCGTRIVAGVLGSQCARCLLSFGSQAGGVDDPDTSSSPPDFLAGHRFDDYELIEEIARGGMGVVYRARQISLQREVAVKLILSGELADRTAREMFRNEALAAANLQHQHIVPVYEAGEYEMQHYLAMRLIPGGRNIAQWAAALPPEGRERRIAAAAGQVARAVAHAHERGVLHRDLKPSNVLWDPNDGPQVTDFGLAKLMDAPATSLTLGAQMLGSPSYMAPEQTGGRLTEITTATDVYGIGAVLYELLSGRPPFAGKSAISTARMVAEEAPPPLQGVSKDLRTVCFKCLEKNPGHRYAAAATLADDLDRFTRGEPVRARPLAPAERLWRWAQRKPAIAVLLTVCTAAVIAGVTGIFWQWREAETARGAQGVALEDAKSANAAQAEALTHLRWQEMDNWLERGDPARALARTALFIREDPSNWQAAMYAMSIVDQHSFSVIAAPEIVLPPSSVLAAMISPDGKWIARADVENVVHVMEAATGRETAAFSQEDRIEITKPGNIWSRLKSGEGLKTKARPVTAIALGSGSLPLAVATDDGQVTLRSITGDQPTVLDGTSGSKILELAWCADGSRILARSSSSVRVWATATPAEAPLRVTLNGGVTHAAMSASGSCLLVWNKKDAVVWDAAARTELFRMNARDGFECGAVSADGRRAALAEPRTATRIWDVPSRSELPALPGIPSELPLIALNGDGSRLTAGGHGVPLAIHDVASSLRVSPGMWTHVIGDHPEHRPFWLFASPDGQRIASMGVDETIWIWDAATGHKMRSPMRTGTGGASVPCIRFCAGGEALFVHKINRQGIQITGESITIWKGTAVRAPVRSQPEDVSITGSALSLDGNLGAATFMKARNPQVLLFRVVNPATGKTILEQPIAGVPMLPMFSPDNRRAFCSAKAFRADGVSVSDFYAWSLESGEKLWQSKPHSGEVFAAAVSPDGALIAAGWNRSLSEGKLILLDAASGAETHTMAMQESLTTIRFAPDQSGRVLTAGTRGEARLWDSRTGEPLQTFRGHDAIIAAAAWSPDARMIATAAPNGVIVWDVQTGKALGPALPHLAWLSHVEFSPDGRTLATTCRDGTVRLWNPRTGAPLCPPRRQGDSCDTVRFNPAGATFLVRDTRGFRFWDVERAEPVTMHFSMPWGGIGTLDCESHRAILSPDGTRVFLGAGGNQTELWTVEQPAGPAPAWFPDFLETLALIRLDPNGASTIVPGQQIFRVKEEIGQAPANDAFAKWARRVLGE